MGAGEEQDKPIIVVKKGGKHGGHHGGAWKVAYADFVTAMMAFFLVMWLVNQSDAVKESVGGYFRDPAGFTEKAGKGILQGSAGALKEPKPVPPPPETAQQKMEEARTELKETGESIMKALKELPGLMEIASRVEIEVTDEGMRIQMMESGDSTFFDLGSAHLSGSGEAAVKTIGDALAKIDYDIIIEGHTDSLRYSRTRGYSNWELSSDRANTARRLLEQSGIDPSRFVEIRAFADHRLRYPGNPGDPRNRRISILVLNPFSPSPPDETDTDPERVADRETY